MESVLQPRAAEETSAILLTSLANLFRANPDLSNPSQRAVFSSLIYR